MKLRDEKLCELALAVIQVEAEAVSALSRQIKRILRQRLQVDAQL